MVDVTKLRREAMDSHYTHMTMLPPDVVWLCNEINKLRAKVTELGGDPYEEPEPKDADAPNYDTVPPVEHLHEADEVTPQAEPAPEAEAPQAESQPAETEQKTTTEQEHKQ